MRVPLSVEATRDLFVREMVQRRAGSIGLEMNLAGHADARRRFVLAIQGWERTPWMRPLLTRLEGYFERTPTNDHTYVVFVRRGLSLPLFVLGLLLPYTVTRLVVDEWPPSLNDLAVIGLALAIVALGSLALLVVERRVYKLLTKGLSLTYGNPPVEKH